MRIESRSIISTKLTEAADSCRPTAAQRAENTKNFVAYARSLKSTSPAEQPVINSNFRESSKVIPVSIETVTPADETSLAATIAKNIVEGIFATANVRTPEETLLDELHSHHRPNELHVVWRVAQLVRNAGFEIFVLDEGGSQVKQKLGMSPNSVGTAHRPTKSIVLDSWEVCKFATDVCRVRPHAAMTATILHELGHLIDTAPATDAQREVQAWATARKLLEIHNFHDLCRDWEFNRVRDRCLESYGVYA
jgi:hypothetical protein